ncbi:hypothetical protein ACHAWC_002434 [Mediolabrus comicus]
MKGLLKELLILISLFLLHYLDTPGSTTTVAVAAAASTATATEAVLAVAEAEDKAKAASSQILPGINKQHSELSHEILHVLEVSRGFEKPTSTNSDSAQRGLKKKKQPQIKRARERASEPEGKGGKNSAQSKSSAIEFSFYQAVVKQRDTCQEKLNELEEELNTCQAERDALKLKESLPKYLYVQQADKCVVKRGEEVGQFILESSAFLSVTERFTDKPLRFESSLSTDEWFASRFNDIFGESSPNTAMAMVDEGESTGTVVAVYSYAYPGSINQDGETVYAYKMYQSPDQASIASLEALLGDADEVTIDFCSMFIDDSSGTPCYDNLQCHILLGNDKSYCHFDFDNCPPEANTCGKCKPYNTQCEKGSGAASAGLGEFSGTYVKLSDIDRTQPFQLCWRAYENSNLRTPIDKYCWSDAYYDTNTERFEACQPQGYWSAVEPSLPSNLQGPWPCGANAACDTFYPPEPKRCCAPALGTFVEDNSSYTCWQANTGTDTLDQYCWSNSTYYHVYTDFIDSDLNADGINSCDPQGDWEKANPVDGSCGSPCDEFARTYLSMKIGVPVC